MSKRGFDVKQEKGIYPGQQTKRSNRLPVQKEFLENWEDGI